MEIKPITSIEKVQVNLTKREFETIRAALCFVYGWASHAMSSEEAEVSSLVDYWTWPETSKSTV